MGEDWIPRPGAVVRYMTADGYYYESTVVGSWHEGASLDIKLSSGNYLKPTANGWVGLIGFHDERDLKVWNGDGNPLPPGAGYGTPPARRDGLPFPGTHLRLVLSDGIVVECRVEHTDGNRMWIDVADGCFVNPDGTLGGHDAAKNGTVSVEHAELDDGTSIPFETRADLKPR